MPKIYKDTLYILEQHPSTGKNVIISIDDLKDQDMESYYYPLDLEKDLINHIIMCNTYEANSLLKYVLDKNLKEKHLNKEALSLFVFAITSTIHRIVQILNKSMSDFFPDNMIIFLELKMIDEPNKLQEKIIEIFNILLSSINAENEKLNTAQATEMLNYIHENYNKDISLADIAEHFNVSQSYISAQFKNSTGYNYKDYLNFYRVKRAKEILETNKYIKIKDLARILGYNNTYSSLECLRDMKK